MHMPGELHPRPPAGTAAAGGGWDRCVGSPGDRAHAGRGSPARVRGRVRSDGGRPVRGVSGRTHYAATIHTAMTTAARMPRVMERAQVANARLYSSASVSVPATWAAGTRGTVRPAR